MRPTMPKKKRHSQPPAASETTLALRHLGVVVLVLAR